MREFIGPTSNWRHEVAFVPGDAMRVAAASNTAAYLWPPEAGEPAVMQWNENAWGQPVLEVSPDGRWLVAGPTERLRGWDISKPTPKGPADLACQGLVLTNFADDGRLNVVVQFIENRNPALSVDRWKLASTKPTRDRKAAELPPNLDPPFQAMNSATCRHTNAISTDGSLLILAVRKAVHVYNVVAGRLSGTHSAEGLPRRGFALARPIESRHRRRHHPLHLRSGDS